MSTLGFALQKRSNSGVAVSRLGVHFPATLWTATEVPSDNDDLSVASEAHRLLAMEVRKCLAPLDQLPYTETFDSIVQRFASELPVHAALSRVPNENLKHGVWLLCLRVRKSGTTTPFQDRNGEPTVVPPSYSVDLLDSLMPVPWSQRDNLPFTRRFAEMRRAYNARASSTSFPVLGWHEFWLAVLAEAKKRRRSLDAVGLGTTAVPGQLELFGNE